MKYQLAYVAIIGNRVRVETPALSYCLIGRIYYPWRDISYLELEVLTV